MITVGRGSFHARFTASRSHGPAIACHCSSTVTVRSKRIAAMSICSHAPARCNRADKMKCEPHAPPLWCGMAFPSMRDFAAKLEAAGELVRITEPVRTELEITALADREM